MQPSIPGPSQGPPQPHPASAPIPAPRTSGAARLAPSKQGLGRGLGVLLDNTKTTTDAPEGARVHISPGLATLLRGTQPAETDADAKVDSSSNAGPAWPNRAVLLTSLVLADVMLVALATFLVLGRHKPIGSVEVVLVSVAFVIGAWLTCLAFWGR